MSLNPKNDKFPLKKIRNSAVLSEKETKDIIETYRQETLSKKHRGLIEQINQLDNTRIKFKNLLYNCESKPFLAISVLENFSIEELIFIKKRLQVKINKIRSKIQNKINRKKNISFRNKNTNNSIN